MAELDKFKKLFNLNEEIQILGEQTSLQRQYNKLIEDTDRLVLAILIQMKGLIVRGYIPSWENFLKTRIWTLLSMNILPLNAGKYEAKWKELFAQLGVSEGQLKDIEQDESNE